ncbi:MAG TPA: Asp-tRNA(Asn)/Glu-tRNA(Gln) amidotransferase subunit GatC [Bryobacteraceae bacterium]|nr:Asp-tRNA(Asn)/Glu-tRNA(Gln) amidotransferase subunit GatC [Bryobacteraceae bacterium]
MKITEPEVRYVADLANLKLTDDEVARMSRELDEILTHIETLKELDTSSVEPMAQVLYDADESATLRPDIERETLGNAAALANAPLASNGYYKVPRVIER